MKLRYTRPARTDVTSILDYVSDFSPQAAKRVRARIQAVTDLLRRHPMAGKATDNPTIRRMTTAPYPYVIFYEVTNDAVVIHAVRHGARDPHDNPGSTLGFLHEQQSEFQPS
jgi:toxin ParE1/3/4